MMHNLRIRQQHINASLRPFGTPGMDPGVVDQMLIKEEIRLMKRRVLCKECFEYKSTNGSCSC